MNAPTRFPTMSLIDDAKTHARAMYVELQALEETVAPQACLAIHATMWLAAKAMAGHLGITARELLDLPVARSGGHDDKDPPPGGEG